MKVITILELGLIYTKSKAALDCCVTTKSDNFRFHWRATATNKTPLVFLAVESVTASVLFFEH